MPYKLRNEKPILRATNFLKQIKSNLQMSETQYMHRLGYIQCVKDFDFMFQSNENFKSNNSTAEIREFYEKNCGKAENPFDRLEKCLNYKNKLQKKGKKMPLKQFCMFGGYLDCMKDQAFVFENQLNDVKPKDNGKVFRQRNYSENELIQIFADNFID